jgi:hypothetical protein
MGLDDLRALQQEDPWTMALMGEEQSTGGEPSKILVRLYGRHPVWTNGAPWYGDVCKNVIPKLTRLLLL